MGQMYAIQEDTLLQMAEAVKEKAEIEQVKVAEIPEVIAEIPKIEVDPTLSIPGDAACAEATGTRFAQIESELINKVPTTRTVNGKALDQDIELTYSDVGADEFGSAASALQLAREYSDTEINKLKSGDITVANAEFATRASQDENGNNIASTYETKTDASSKLEESKIYTDSKVDAEAVLREEYDTKIAKDAMDYTDSKNTEAKEYTDTKVAEETTAREEANAQILADANSYTDTKVAEFGAIAGDIAETKTYTDNKIAEEATARETAISEALAEAKEYADTEVAGLVGAAPTTLDTIEEVANAIEQNATVVEALDQAIGSKANQSSLDEHTSDTSVHMSSEEKSKLEGIEEGANKTTVDEALSDTSDNPVQNKVITSRINNIESNLYEVNEDVYSNTKAYKLGDYCIYENALYEFLQDKEAGEWDASVVERTSVLKIVSSIGVNAVLDDNGALSFTTNNITNGDGVKY